MAYVWFAQAQDTVATYVDYDSALGDDLAFAIRRVSDDVVVGVFIQYLDAVIREMEELERERRSALSLGLLVEREQKAGRLGIAAPA